MLKKLHVLALGLAFVASAVQAGPKRPEVAAPFGVVVGKTTCAEVEQKFSAPIELIAGLATINHRDPQALYPGASVIKMMCESPSSPVEFISIVASSDGADSAGPRSAFSALQKYKLVKGGPIPLVGDGFALFTDGAGNSIQLSAPHMSLEFEVSYMTPQLHEGLLAAQKARRAQQNVKERDL